MSLYGVKIDGADTLEAYGLCVLADISIAEATPREMRVEIPGMDGTLDCSRALTGAPTFGDREISFKLFKPTADAQIAALRTILAAKCGYEVKVILPDDTDHYWRGVLAMGEHKGYNGGTIPLTLTAYPYKLKHAPTVVTAALTAEETEISLPNEMMRVVPVFEPTADTTLVCSGNTYALSAGQTYRNTAIVLTAGANTVKAKAADGGMLTITYQEGTL